MKIKKLKINGYDVFIYNTKKYSTINMRFLFEMPYTKDNIYMCDILEEYMIHSTNKYKTRKSMGERRMECYSMNFGINNYNKGEMMFTEATFNFYDPKLVKDDYFKDALEFAGEILLHPNFEGGKLDKEELTRSKDNMILSFSDELTEARFKSSRSFKKTMYPDTYITRDMIETKAEYESLLNSYTDKDLIEMHDKLINHSLIGLVIMGNIDDKYIKYIEDIFKFKSTKKLDKNFKEKLKICTKTPFHTVVEDEEFSDSILRIVYKCPNRSLKERLTYSMITQILSSSGMILHKVLRDEMKLVYSTYAKYITSQKNIIFYANLEGKNEEKAIEGVKAALTRLRDRELLESLIEKVQKENELALYTYEENKWNPFNELQNRAYALDGPTFPRRAIIMKTITVDDCLACLDKMQCVKIHFYKGVKK